MKLSYKLRWSITGIVMVVVPLVLLLWLNDMPIQVILEMGGVIALLIIAIMGVGILLRLYDP